MFQRIQDDGKFLDSVIFSDESTFHVSGRVSTQFNTQSQFFLWGFVKDQVFVPPLPANVVELRTRITAAVAKVTPELLRSVWQETDYRWEVCRITSGSHIEPQLSEVKLGVFCYILTVQNLVYVLCINFYKLSKL